MKRAVVKYIILTVVFLIAAIGVNAFRSSQAASSSAITEKRQKMERTLTEYQMKKTAYQENYNKFPQPIESKDLDLLQKELITQMSASGLDVRSMTKKPDPPITPPAPGKEAPFAAKYAKYEVVTLGSWSASMAYLNGLRSSPHLIVIVSLRMESERLSDQVRSTFVYKVYQE